MWTRITTRLRRLSLAQRFMLASLIIFVSGMYGIGSWVAGRIENGVIHRSAGTTVLYVDSFIAPRLQGLASSDTLAPAEVADLNHIFADTPLGQQIVAFKVWGTQGRVIYSTEPSIVGQTFPPDADRAQAWQGQVSADISSLDAAENVQERTQASHLLEIYTPVRLRGSDRVIAVAEFYQRTDDLDREVATAKRHSWLIVGGVTLVMYLLLAGLVQRASDTIARQQRELGAQVNRLTDLLHLNAQLNLRVRRAAARTSALNERFLRRFSAELHDGPAQDLSLALLQIDNAMLHCADTNNGSHEHCLAELGTIQQNVQRALQEVRTISAGQLLPQLSRLGLTETLEHVVRAHERKTCTHIEVQLAELPADAPLSIKIAVYRVVQEALTNAFRHAGGAGQRLHAAVADDILQVEIADGGSGFDPSALIASDEHLGLVGMRERVASLGGLLTVESRPGQGTVVTATLPLSAEALDQQHVQIGAAIHA